MEAASSKDSSVASSPFPSPSIGVLLKIKIISWSQETGLPVTVRVRVGERTFNLHKNPLSLKSGYFKKQLIETTELELPKEFPGGPETFEMIALFIYGSSTLIDPFNIAALRCAAEFLEMTEEHCSGNLCQRFDLYLNQVVLQSWDDTLIVLQRCQTLLPWSEELLIVGRCIESLAFMACMEILDPERRRDKPVVTLDSLAGQAWSCEMAKEIVIHDLWIKDLIALPFGFFRRIIGSLRRQGMKEKYVSPIIVLYANKWVLSKKTRQFWENSGNKIGDIDASNRASIILKGILDLFPVREKARRVIPVGFYFALLSKSFEVGLKSESRAKLQDQIASQLHMAQVEDFLIPNSGIDSISSTMELATMESIFSTYLSFNMESNHIPSSSNSIVAELWDTYLSLIASDPKMEPKRFIELVETAHLDVTQEEKGAACKYLNCQKLSQEACIEAVQNELMPLRLIVQALFVQQLNTHQVFKECSDSSRFAHCGEFSGSLSSSRCPNSKSQNLAESPYSDGAEPVSKTLNFLLQNDIAAQRYELSRKEYESTSFRIQNLEQELLSLKQSMKPYGMESRSLSKKRNPVGQVTGCISSVNFASQRRYASRLLKVFRRITLFGNRKSKTKPGKSGQSAKTV
ncbi:hypothetical protein JCGZ_18465 [Jatropha curcas]|uniref:NPH3 domain-containing protein n=1 Tax=Jatropha curcas TaxID=180498 RepID=A0A067K0Z2_JATCU|nr:hypothetical protein JCGZ_18465 [Jatropha curcas]